MGAKKLRKGDEVIVTTGKSKGIRGNVMRVFPNDKVLVEGANLAKKHERPNPQIGTQGGIIEKEMPLHISNVALYNPQTQAADRVAFKILEDGRKVRIFKSTGENIDV